VNQIVADSGGSHEDELLNTRLSYCFGLEDMLALYGLGDEAEDSTSETIDAVADYGEESSEEEEMKASEREVIQAARNRDLKKQPVDEAGQRITDDDMEFEDSSYSPSQDGEDDESESDLTRQESKESSASAESSNKSVKILEFDDEGNISPTPKKNK
jgi:Mg-chelatase subunit ChlI